MLSLLFARGMTSVLKVSLNFRPRFKGVRVQNPVASKTLLRATYDHMSFKTCLRMALSVLLVCVTPVSRVCARTLGWSESRERCELVSAESRFWNSRLLDPVDGLRLWPASEDPAGRRQFIWL
jgi:hypothetical protein